MTNSTQDTARDRARASLTAGIKARLYDLTFGRFLMQNDQGLLQAVESVTDYVERCEESGITMHPADVRRLIASALGVSSS